MNLNQVTIPSLDVKKSVAFYKTLGLHLIVKAYPRYARFECPEGNSTFSIHLVEKLMPKNGTRIYFEVKELDKKVEELQMKGIVFNQFPEDKSWGWREASLNDPDGNQLILFYGGDARKNPPWRIKEIPIFMGNTMIEIERKFLVLSEAYKKEAFKHTHIVQGFLNTDPYRTVRVRLYGTYGFITVKGISNESGTSRLEWEKEISTKEANTLLSICETGVIEKIRYEIKKGSHVFEVDEFMADNQGLIIAEIELSSENEPYEKPLWLGKEVTGITKYYNSQLSKHPFKNWNK